MTKKEKEEERIEKIIRGLLRLAENRRCINCNSLGPQYVCTTFLTFVCTNCSGVHREFTHRVKSVSMAKFSAEEVSGLQAGGNERARQIYFKEWDPQRNSYPDGSNLHRLRDFIKHVYVERRYCGDRSLNYEDRFEKRERCRPGGRSDDRILKHHYDERRSPQFPQENSKSGKGLKRNPVRFEIVDDRVRSSVRESDNRRFSHRESGFGRVSPDRQKNMDRSSSPVVQSVKDILGENISPLLVGENSKTNDRTDASSRSKKPVGVQAVEDKNQNSESLIDFNTDSKPSDAVVALPAQENHQSDEGNYKLNESFAQEEASPTPKPNTLEFLLFELSVPSVEPAGSLSDKSTNDNPPPSTSGSNMLMSAGVSEAVPPGQLLSLPDNTDASPAASMGQTLALSSSLDASATVLGGNMPTGNVTSAASMGQISTPSNSTGVTGTTSEDSMLNVGTPTAYPVEQTLSLLDSMTSSATSVHVQPSNESNLQAVSDNIHGDSTCKVPNGQQVSIIEQHQLSAFPGAADRTSEQLNSTTTNEAPNNQPWTSLNMPNAQGSSSTSSAEHPSQEVTIAQHSKSGINPQHLPVETKSSGRKELPADLFTANYSPVPGPVPGWQSASPYNMGFGMQHHPNPVPVPPYPTQAKSSNPFDLINETTSMQISPFPSMGNLQAALSYVSVPGALSRTSSIDTNPSGLMATQLPSYASAMPLQSSSLASSTLPDAYMGQQLHMSTLPTGELTQGANGGFGSDAVFGSLNMIQQSPSGYQLPLPPNSLPSTGGNPFG